MAETGPGVNRPAPPMGSAPEQRIWGLGRKWWVLIAIGVGTFMSALDASIVNTVLPVLRESFGVPFPTIQWVATVYLLVVSGLLLTFGRLGDLYGHKPVFLAGFVIFVLSSMVCGLAPSALVLIACRGIQAIGAAMLGSNSPAILTANFPGAQRGQALGLSSTATYLGLTVGPPLGGWLAQQFSWRYVFYINVPVGALALWLTWRLQPRNVLGAHREHFDPLGAAVFLAGLVALLMGLNRGSEWGWSSLPVLALLVAALVLLLGFVWLEKRAANPMLDLSLFRSRLFSGATASATLNYICLSSALFLLPFYLIQARGIGSAQAGQVMVAQSIVMALVAPASGALSDRLGSRWLATLGMLVMAGGLLLLSRMGADEPLGLVALGLATVGLGTGIFISPNTSALMGAAPRGRQGVASGVLATVRTAGQALGTGVAGAIFATRALAGATEALFGAIHLAFLVAAGIATLGAVVAAARGNHQ